MATRCSAPPQGTACWKSGIGGDFLLIHQQTNAAILLARAGSHADLFEN